MLPAGTNALFTLDAAGNPRPAASFAEWSVWYSPIENRRIAYDILGSAVIVSTMFLGRNWGTDTIPIFFDTVIIGGALHGEQLLGATYEEALENHNQAMALVRARPQPVEDYTNG